MRALGLAALGVALLASAADAQGARCGVERWNVKVLRDADAGAVATDVFMTFGMALSMIAFWNAISRDRPGGADRWWFFVGRRVSGRNDGGW